MNSYVLYVANAIATHVYIFTELLVFIYLLI